MNDHRDKFSDIHKYKDDFKKIFVNNFFIKGSRGWKMERGYKDFLNGDGELDSVTKSSWDKNGLDGFIFDCGAKYMVIVPKKTNDSLPGRPKLIRAVLKYGIMRM